MSVPAMLVFDVVLSGLALGLVVATLGARDAGRMTMLFIAFGSVVALIWVRLRAPDLALAEAAIGAAVTGGLLLRAKALMPPDRGEPLPWVMQIPAIGVSLGAFSALAWALLSMDWAARPSLAPLVFERLGESGVENPVTAVLLNYRAYDTLLEVAVLLAAVAGVWMLGPRIPVPRRLQDDPLFLALARLLVPLLCLLSGYLLWLGAFAPGGAFQAGAILSGAIVFLLLAGVHAAPGEAVRRWLRVLLVAGLVVFVAVGAGVTFAGGALLQYPPMQAKNLILLIEGTLTVSIALTLVLLFLGGRPEEDG